MDVLSIPDHEIASHNFEIIKLYSRGEEWRAQFAIDNVLYPEFIEPKQNVLHMDEDSFLRYMKGQALTMAAYWRQCGQA